MGYQHLISNAQGVAHVTVGEICIVCRLMFFCTQDFQSAHTHTHTPRCSLDHIHPAARLLSDGDTRAVPPDLYPEAPSARRQAVSYDDVFGGGVNDCGVLLVAEFCAH